MSISEVSLYKALKTKLGDETADELVEFVKNQVQNELNSKTGVFLTKDDKIELLTKMNNDKVELIDRINKAKTETIIWIVGIGVLQFILTLLTKFFFSA